MNPWAEECARSALSKRYAREELGHLDREAASITAHYVALIAAAAQTEGAEDGKILELLAYIIETGCSSRSAIRRKTESMDARGDEYLIIGEAEE